MKNLKLTETMNYKSATKQSHKLIQKIKIINHNKSRAERVSSLILG